MSIGKRVFRIIFSGLRWLGAHARSLYAVLGLYIALAFVATLLGLLAFAGIAELVQEGVTQPTDEAILRWLQGWHSPSLDVAAMEVTALGSTLVLAMVVLASTAFLWMSHHRYSVALLWIAVAGGGVLNSVLKEIFDRPRPEVFEWVAPYAGFASFPSGHAMSSMIVYSTLAYLVVRLEPTRWMRRLTLAIAALVIILVGLSRLYLGVHYPSDVLAGFIAGFAWANLCAFGLEVLRYFRGRQPGIERDEHDLEKGTQPIRDALGGG